VLCAEVTSTPALSYVVYPNQWESKAEGLSEWKGEHRRRVWSNL
jgi:hypothetical protein